MSASKQEKLSLQQQLKSSGLKGRLFRIRHGKKTISRIKALEQNITNGEMRLNEGVGGLDRFDYQKIQRKKAEHSKTIRDFKARHDRDIKNTEKQAYELAQSQIIQEALNSAEQEKHAKIIANNLEKAQQAKQAQQKQREIERAAQAQKQLQAIKQEQKQAVQPSLSNDNFGDEFLSKDAIAENVKAKQSQHQNKGLSGSFMDELSTEQRQKIEDYNRDNPAPDHDDIGEKQERGNRPELD